MAIYYKICSDCGTQNPWTCSVCSRKQHVLEVLKRFSSDAPAEKKERRLLQRPVRK